MKLKYLFPSLIAVITMLVSCSDDNDPTYLDEIRVSSSYVAIDVDGGSTSIEIQAKGDWDIDTTGIPKWLTVSPVSGSAGKTTVTFEADKTVDGRTAELKLTCNGKTQNINVIQGLSTVSSATCAEVIAGPESKTYRVTGTVTSIANTTYGNWYLTDETGTLYIYGTLDAQGNEKNFASLGIDVGDIVTVEGPKTVYGTTVELVNVTVIAIEKSLVKVDSLDIEDGQLPLEGGDFTVSLTCKTSNGISVEIPEDAQEWLSIVAISGGSAPTVKFHVAANTGGDREATIVFNTTDGKKNYSSETTIYQKGAILEVSIAEFNAAEVGGTVYRLTGVVSSIVSAEKGRFYLKDYSGETYIYNLSEFEGADVKVGDIVTVTGKRDEYNGTIEMTSAALENVKHVTEISIADFLEQEDSKDVYYMVSGTITSIADDGAVYGNLYITDGENELYVYGCYPGYGATGDARKNFLETAGIKVGDKLTMIGYKDTYKETIELCGGIYFAHESAK